MRRRYRNSLIALGAIAALIGGGIVAFHAYVDMDELDSYAEAELERVINRDVTIAGEIELEPSFNAKLTARGVSIANPEWAPDAPMISNADVTFEVDPFAYLLRDTIRIENVTVSNADISIRLSQDGDVNWDLWPDRPEDEPRQTPPQLLEGFDVRTVQVVDSRLSWYDARNGNSGEAVVDSLTLDTSSKTRPIEIALDGSYENIELQVAGEGGSLSVLTDITSPYPIDLTIDSPGVTGRIAGEIGRPVFSGESELNLDLSVTDPAIVRHFTDQPIPDGATASLNGHAESGPSGWAVSDVNVTFEVPGKMLVTGRRGSGRIDESGFYFFIPGHGEGSEFSFIGEIAEEELPPLGAWTVDADITYSNAGLAFTNFRGHSERLDGLTTDAARGWIDLTGEGFEIEADVSARGPDSETLGELFDAKLPTFRQWDAAGRLKINSESTAVEGLSMNTSLAENFPARIIEGRIESSDRTVDLFLPTTLEGPSTAELGEIFGFSVPNAGAFTVDATISGNANAPALTDIYAIIGRGESYTLQIVGGHVDNIATGDGINVTFDARGPDIESFARRLTIGVPDLGRFDLAGRISGEADDLTLSSLTGIVGSEGSVQVEVEQASVVNLTDASGINAVVRVMGPSTAEAAKYFSADIPALGAFDLRTRVYGRPDKLALAEVTGTVSDGDDFRLEIEDGAMADLATGDGIEARIEARGNSISALARKFSADIPALGPYDLEGYITGSPDALAVSDLTGSVGTRASGELIIRQGRIGDLTNGTGIDASIVARGNSISAFARTFSADVPALGPYNLQGRIAGSPEDLSVSGLSGSVGSETGLALDIRRGRVDNLVQGTGLDASVIARGNSVADAAGKLGIPIDIPGTFEIATDVSGTLGSPDFRKVDGRLVLPGASVHADGTVKVGETLQAFDLELVTDAESLARLSPLFDSELPETVPLNASGRISGTPERFEVSGLHARMADSSAVADLTVDISGSIPQVEGVTDFDRFDPVRIFTGSRSGEASAARDGIEDDALPVAFLDKLRADILFSANTLILAGQPVEGSKARLTLRDGVLDVNDVRGQLAGGFLAGEARMSGDAGGAAAVAARMSVTGLETSKLEFAGKPEEVSGTFNFDMNVSGAGRSVDAILLDLDGEAFVFTADAQVRGVPLNSLVQDLDVFTLFDSSDSSVVHLNCAIANFDIMNGVAQTKAMADTPRMTIAARGAIDVAGNQIRMELEPRAKSAKLSAAPIPVDIVGPLDEPSVEPKVGRAVGSILGGLLGGLLIPLNQIAGATGDDVRNACGEAIQRARSRPTYAGDQG